METTHPNLTLADWFNGTKLLIKLGFAKKEIQETLEKLEITVNDLTETQGMQSEPRWTKRYEVVKEKGYPYQIEEYYGEYSKKVQKVGMEIRIPSQYQGLKHGKILFALFSNRWKWFNTFEKQVECSNKRWLSDIPISQVPEEFKDLTPKDLRFKFIIEKELNMCSKWEIYELRSEDSDLYLKTESGSLYVPVKALVESDYSLIQKRMNDYFKGYHKVSLAGYGLNHRGRSEAQYLLDQQEYQDKVLLPLESAEAKWLKECLKKNK